MLTILKDNMKYYKLYIEILLVCFIVSEILEWAKLPFLPILSTITIFLIE